MLLLVVEVAVLKVVVENVSLQSALKLVTIRTHSQIRCVVLLLLLLLHFGSHHRDSHDPLAGETVVPALDHVHQKTGRC